MLSTLSGKGDKKWFDLSDIWEWKWMVHIRICTDALLLLFAQVCSLLLIRKCSFSASLDCDTSVFWKVLLFLFAHLLFLKGLAALKFVFLDLNHTFYHHRNVWSLIESHRFCTSLICLLSHLNFNLSFALFILFQLFHHVFWASK